MGAMSRRKGASGERELASLIADLTGWDVKRRVRQHDGDSDLDGVPGWAVESKRVAKALPADLDAYWEQAVRQAGQTHIPVLFVRENRKDWCAIWPLAVALEIQTADMWVGRKWTAQTSVEAWACIAQDVALRREKL